MSRLAEILYPILFGATLMVGLGVVNQELVIPRVADALLADRTDQSGNKIIAVQGAFEPNLVHIDGERAIRNGLEVSPFYVTLPEQMTGTLVHLSAKRASYLPARAWLLEETVPPTMENPPPILESTDPGRYYLKVQEVDFDVLTRNKNWYMFAATNRLRKLLYRADGRPQPAIAVLFHMR